LPGHVLAFQTIKQEKERERQRDRKKNRAFFMQNLELKQTKPKFFLSHLQKKLVLRENGKKCKLFSAKVTESALDCICKSEKISPKGNIMKTFRTVILKT
jgi:tRNA U34 2-thiouridine synthase MnmA/TrmU